jgi:hypothetical protein
VVVVVGGGAVVLDGARPEVVGVVLAEVVPVGAGAAAPTVTGTLLRDLGLPPLGGAVAE